MFSFFLSTAGSIVEKRGGRGIKKQAAGHTVFNELSPGDGSWQMVTIPLLPIFWFFEYRTFFDGTAT